MIKKRFFLLGLSIILTGLQPLLSQYPQVPKEIQASADSLMKEAERLSDSAWVRALPVIQYEARMGKPFIPWASRPTDLPQADIPAFPGAMGGGEFSFGGRGGRVIVVKSL